MLKKWGKFMARWTGADGRRHSKACKTKSAAARLQREMCRQREAKKARPTRRLRRSSKRGPNKAAGSKTAKSPKTSSRHSAISAPAI